MPFIYKRNKNANGGRVMMEHKLKDSTAFTVGDSVKLASGVLDISGVANVYGIIVGFVKADGGLLTDNGAGGDFVDTYTTPASNTVKAIVDISIDSIYSVTADATLGTTTGSGLAGYNMDVVAASDQLDESSALATTAQFFSYGPDPDGDAPSNSVLVSIQESQVKI